MKIKMLVRWYDRKDDMEPDYDSEHYGSFNGDTPAEVMYQLNVFRHTHDLAKYSKIEIVGIY